MTAIVAIALVLALLASPRPHRNRIVKSDRIAAATSAKATKPLKEGQLELAKALAYVRWGPTRCADGIVYRYAPLRGRILAQAHWWFYDDSPKVYRDCKITFDADPRKVATRFPYYCATVFHEFGHLSGHRHSKDPDNVMYPVISQRNIPPTCER